MTVSDWWQVVKHVYGQAVGDVVGHVDVNMVGLIHDGVVDLAGGDRVGLVVGDTGKQSVTWLQCWVHRWRQHAQWWAMCTRDRVMHIHVHGYVMEDTVGQAHDCTYTRRQCRTFGG